jgi:hypothetical protein
MFFFPHSGPSIFAFPSPTKKCEDKIHKTVTAAVILYGLVSHPNGSMEWCMGLLSSITSLIKQVIIKTLIFCTFNSQVSLDH